MTHRKDAKSAEMRFVLFVPKVFGTNKNRQCPPRLCGDELGVR